MHHHTSESRFLFGVLPFAGAPEITPGESCLGNETWSSIIPCASSSGFHRAADGEGKSHLPLKGSNHPALARGCSATCPKRRCNSWGKKLGMDVLNTCRAWAERDHALCTHLGRRQSSCGTISAQCCLWLTIWRCQMKGKGPRPGSGGGHQLPTSRNHPVALAATGPVWPWEQLESDTGLPVAWAWSRKLLWLGNETSLRGEKHGCGKRGASCQSR